jgi:oligoribonuclease (3'-5' exoribonuclease)
VIAVHQSDEQLALMDDWNVRTHTGSGLVERVKASQFDDNAAAAGHHRLPAAVGAGGQIADLR